jgi:translation initiation factor 6 (eIF-6)
MNRPNRRAGDYPGHFVPKTHKVDEWRASWLRRRFDLPLFTGTANAGCIVVGVAVSILAAWGLS